MIYLDNAATTKPYTEVVDEVTKYLRDYWFNPSSLYSPSVNVHNDIDCAKETVGDFIGASKEEIYFTSCGSESNCWAIEGFVKASKLKGRDCTVITSVIEHKSIIKCVESLDCDFDFIGVDKYGFLKLENLESILKTIPNNHDVLVSIQFANNEVGTIQDIESISNIVHRYNAVLHTDATQAFGQVDIDVKLYGIDMMTASGHKIHAPKGIGFLYIKDGINISPIIFGSQMNEKRGGTENVPFIMGFKKAIEITKENMVFENQLELLKKQCYLINKMKFDCNAVLNGSTTHRLINNLSLTLSDDVSSEALIYMLDMCGIYISAGSACNATSNEPSYVLRAIGLTDDEAFKTIRITLTYETTYEDIDKFISEFKKQVKLIKN